MDDGEGDTLNESRQRAEVLATANLVQPRSTRYSTSFRALATAALAVSMRLQGDMNPQLAVSDLAAQPSMGDEDRIEVPHYLINAGQDFKFVSDPCEIDLKGIISPQKFFDVITALNEALKKTRANPGDMVLLATSLLIIPLIPWGIRKKNRTSARKKCIRTFVDEFNSLNQDVQLIWSSKSSSKLVFERCVMPLARLVNMECGN